MEKGFIALITVLIILGIILLIGLGISQISIGESQMALQKSQSSQAYYLANLCAEEALIKLKETDGSYAGEIKSNIIENGDCAISVSGSWIIEVLASFQNQTRKMRIEVSQINPETIIDSWFEVADF